MTTNPELVFFNQADLERALPTLDGFDPSEMKAFKAECKQVEAALALLRSYAEARWYAGQCRLSGKINLAKTYEAAAENVYGRLPSWAKW